MQVSEFVARAACCAAKASWRGAVRTMPRGSRERRRLRLGCLAQSTPSRQPDGEDLLNIAHTQARSSLDSNLDTRSRYRCAYSAVRQPMLSSRSPIASRRSCSQLDTRTPHVRGSFPLSCHACYSSPLNQGARGGCWLLVVPQESLEIATDGARIVEQLAIRVHVTTPHLSTLRTSSH